MKDAEGGDAWEFAGSAQPDPIGLTATPGMPFDQFRWMGVTYEEARPGCYNGAERAKDMDIDGVDAEILFPPQRTVGHFLGDEDDDFVMAGIEAYNNFLFEEFCAPDPTRADRHGADPVARHRRRDRRAAQGEGARRQGRRHRQLARRRRRHLRRGRRVLGGRGRRGHAGDDPHPAAVAPAPGRRSAPRRRRPAGTASTAATERGGEGEGRRRPRQRVLARARAHLAAGLHRRVRPLPRAAGRRWSRRASAGCRTSSR